MFLLNALEPIVRPLKQIIERKMEREVDNRVRSGLRLVPITDFAEEDVFVAGYPKSGHTWFQNLVAGIIYGVDPEIAPDTLIQELVPDVHYKQYYKRFQTPMFFKSHHLPRPEYKRVVYLLRDGRDAMVSYFHFNRALYGSKIDFLRMIAKGEYLFPCKWHDHVEQWLSNPYVAKMIVIKYENLLLQPIDELRTFCNFVGVRRSDDFLTQVIEKCSFSKMSKKEKESGWDNPVWPKDKPFVRRGEIGGYKDEMPPLVLNAFLGEASDTLRKCGYE